MTRIERRITLLLALAFGLAFLTITSAAEASHKGRAPLKKNPTTAPAMRAAVNDIKSGKPGVTDAGIESHKFGKWQGEFTVVIVGREGRAKERRCKHRPVLPDKCRTVTIIKWYRYTEKVLIRVDTHGHAVTLRNGRGLNISGFRSRDAAMEGVQFGGGNFASASSAGATYQLAHRKGIRAARDAAKVARSQIEQDRAIDILRYAHNVQADRHGYFVTTRFTYRGQRGAIKRGRDYRYIDAHESLPSALDEGYLGRTYASARASGVMKYLAVRAKDRRRVPHSLMPGDHLITEWHARNARTGNVIRRGVSLRGVRTFVNRRGFRVVIGFRSAEGPQPVFL